MAGDFTKEYALQQFLKAMYGSNEENKTEDDGAFREHVTQEITNRDEQYTNLLKHFVRITSIRNYLKEIFKWSFYLAVIGAIGYLIFIVNKLFNVFIEKATIEQLIEAIPLFITSIVGFVSVIIAIPLAITQYLFSTAEDDNITDIIRHTQQHDTVGRQWTLDFKKLADVSLNSKNDKSKADSGENDEQQKVS